MGLTLSCYSLRRVLLALVFFIIGPVFFVAGRLADDAHHVLLKRLFFQEKAVLVPDEVWHLEVEVVTFHAALEQAENVLEVGVSRE